MKIRIALLLLLAGILLPLTASARELFATGIDNKGQTVLMYDERPYFCSGTQREARRASDGAAGCWAVSSNGNIGITWRQPTNIPFTVVYANQVTYCSPGSADAGYCITQ